VTAAHAVAFVAALCPPVAQAAAQSGSTGTDLRGVTQNWDRTLSAEPGGACPAASARFTCVFNNAGARDNETGLVWGHPQASTMDWWTARTACANDTTGGRKGWRLPTVTELSSPLDPPNAYTLKLPPGHLFAYLSSYYGYWIATLDGIDQPMSAYYPHHRVTTLLQMRDAVGSAVDAGSHSARFRLAATSDWFRGQLRVNFGSGC
jgi:hypothetical protein